MKQLTAGVCAESAVVALWQGLRWEEMGVKHDDLRELIVREVSTCSCFQILVPPVNLAVPIVNWDIPESTTSEKNWFSKPVFQVWQL